MLVLTWPVFLLLFRTNRHIGNGIVVILNPFEDWELKIHWEHVWMSIPNLFLLWFCLTIFWSFVDLEVPSSEHMLDIRSDADSVLLVHYLLYRTLTLDKYHVCWLVSSFCYHLQLWWHKSTDECWLHLVIFFVNVAKGWLPFFVGHLFSFLLFHFGDVLPHH